MNEAVPAVHLTTIDADMLGDVDDNPEAVQFVVKLSAVPPPGWEAEFEPLYAASAFAPKPPVMVNGDTLQVIYLPRYADKLQAFVDALAHVVTQTNAELVKTHDMKTSDARVQRKAEFGRELKKLTLPQMDK